MYIASSYYHNKSLKFFIDQDQVVAGLEDGILKVSTRLSSRYSRLWSRCLLARKKNSPSQVRMRLDQRDSKGELRAVYPSYYMFRTIPNDADLIFQVHLLEVRSPTEAGSESEEDGVTEV